jgi:hypothetical protein
MGYEGIFYASPLAWVGAALVVIIGYFATIRGINVKKSRNYFSKNKNEITLKAAINVTTQTPGE